MRQIEGTGCLVQSGRGRERARMERPRLNWSVRPLCTFYPPNSTDTRVNDVTRNQGLFTVSLATSDPAFDLDKKLNRTFEFSSQELDHLVTTLIEEVQHRGLFTDGFERYPTTVAELGLLQKSVKEFVGNETFASVVKIDKLRMCVTEIRTLLSRVNSARRYPIVSIPIYARRPCSQRNIDCSPVSPRV